MRPTPLRGRRPGALVRCCARPGRGASSKRPLSHAAWLAIASSSASSADLAQAELGELQRLIARPGVQRPQRALARGRDHVVELPGAARVVRDRGEVVAVHLAQRVERGVMKMATFASEQVGLDRLAYQRVPEREDVGFAFDQQAARDEVAQDRDELLVGVPRNRRQQIEVDACDAEHRGGLEHAALLGGQVVELRVHELGQAPRQLLTQAARRDRPSVPRRAALRERTDCRRCARAARRRPGTTVRARRPR